MSIETILGYSQRELEQFKTVCNLLLSRTYIVRMTYQPDKGLISNPNYLFLMTHKQEVADYLSLLDWTLLHDDFNGYFYVRNTDEANRCSLNKTATAIVLALRMIYDENQDRAGLEHDVICTVRDVLEKVVTDYAILPTRPNMDEVKRALTIMENHSVVQRIEGRLNQTSCKFAIMPTILSVVPSDKLDAIVRTLRKEDDDEELEEDIVD